MRVVSRILLRIRTTIDAAIRTGFAFLRRALIAFGGLLSRERFLHRILVAPGRLVASVTNHGKAVASLVVAIFIGALIVKALTRDVVVLRQIGLPAAAKSLGFSEEVAALRLRDGIDSITDRADAFSRDEDEQMGFMPLHLTHDFEIPEYKISYRTLVSSIRHLLNLEDLAVVGEFVCRPQENGWDCPSYKSMVLRLRIVRTADETVMREMPPLGDSSLDQYFLDAAIKVYEEIEPVTLMRYLYHIEEWDEADRLAKRLSRPGSEYRAHGLEIQALIAWKHHESLDEAERLFSSAYEEAPQDQKGYILNSWAVFERREFPTRLCDAIRKLRDALNLEPDFPQAANNLGFALRKAGHIAEALSVYNRAIEINPEYARAYYNRGVLKRHMGDFEGAAEDYIDAIYIDPHYYTAWSALGFANGKMGRLQEAVIAYSNAYDPEKPPKKNRVTLVNWSKALIEIGDLDSARERLNEALRLSQDYDRAHFYVGDVAERVHDLETALAHYRMAAENASFEDAEDWRQASDTQKRIARVARTLGLETAADAAERTAREYDARTKRGGTEGSGACS